MDRLKKAAVSFFGLGYSPFAPGTAGTLGPALLAPLLPASAPFLWIDLGALLVVAAVSIALGPWAERCYGRKDPSPFVLDEVAGYLVTVLATTRPTWSASLLAFFLFRVVDVVKPFPASRMERLPGGFGILLDDVFAALWSLAALRAVLHFVPSLAA